MVVAHRWQTRPHWSSSLIVVAFRFYGPRRVLSAASHFVDGTDVSATRSYPSSVSQPRVLPGTIGRSVRTIGTNGTMCSPPPLPVPLSERSMLDARSRSMATGLSPTRSPAACLYGGSLPSRLSLPPATHVLLMPASCACFPGSLRRDCSPYDPSSFLPVLLRQSDHLRCGALD